jgi:protein involved in ribonucleotide reduction
LDYATSYCLVFEEKDENGNIIQSTAYTDDKQLQTILKVERSVLLEMGLKTEYEAISRNRIKEYYEKTTVKAREYFPNLKNMYRCIKIIYNLDDMQTSLTLDDIKGSKTELNQKVLTFINKQANKNYLSAMDGDSNRYRFTETYALTQHYLSDKLIKLKTGMLDN